MFKRVLSLGALLISLQAAAYQQGEQISDHALQKLNLKADEVTIVDFFAEWCVSCRKELPEVNRFAEQFNGQGVTVVGVDVDEDVELGKAFQRELGLTFRVVADPEQRLVSEFKPLGMPALYYVYQGKILKVRYGAINHIHQVIMDDLKSMGLAR